MQKLPSSNTLPSGTPFLNLRPSKSVVRSCKNTMNPYVRAQVPAQKTRKPRVEILKCIGVR